MPVVCVSGTEPDWPGARSGFVPGMARITHHSVDLMNLALLKRSSTARDLRDIKDIRDCAART
jgi:hypothetical protein